MLLLMLIVVVFVGTIVLSAVNDVPRYPPPPDGGRDYDVRRRGTDV